MPNSRRAFLPGGTFFFTVVPFRLRHLFDKPQCRKILRQAIERTRQKHPFHIDAWVLHAGTHCIWTVIPNSFFSDFLPYLISSPSFFHSARKQSINMDNVPYLFRKIGFNL
ncbi:MAG: hypothetical protein D3922_15340 [Candidatus Electrothrix sp. AR1]|nr:hypothetical protein [Candidatus Electrothrix sp. AR1]